jgi:hypothetical protein
VTLPIPYRRFDRAVPFDGHDCNGCNDQGDAYYERKEMAKPLPQRDSVGAAEQGNDETHD